jgi:hypothetical protein
VAASQRYVYLPRYGACIGCRAGMHCSPDQPPDLHLDAGWKVEEVVGVADGSLGSWLKRESNYPYLLSRNDAEK